ncbi:MULTISPECIES: ParM/StbA family protein [Bacillota]|uniref:ParM/StbA family protein n=1 Tax=Bacillota TaxID=1239 RepID=UPI002570D852|nr:MULTISPECIES: ParM/StbA family protein [Bacillota]
MENIQKIGFDFGRGYVKAYSEVDNIEHIAVFKSVIGEGRDIDLSEYMEKESEKPIYIEYKNTNYFIGILAEKESQVPVRNSRDSKTSNTVEILFAAALSEVAVKEKVDIMLGVPYKNYRKSVLKEVIEKYKGQTIKVKNKINGSTKEVYINNISIFREGDAALIHAIDGKINEDKPVGLVSVGFRTTELSYFDKGFIFNDKMSNTIEFGNRTLLSTVQDSLRDINIMKEVNEIDTSNDYDDLKSKAYLLGSENLAQRIDDIWINKSEMDLYVAGGTSTKLTFDKEFKRVKDAQLATAKGLFEVAKRKF